MTEITHKFSGRQIHKPLLLLFFGARVQNSNIVLAWNLLYQHLKHSTKIYLLKKKIQQFVNDCFTNDRNKPFWFLGVLGKTVRPLQAFSLPLFSFTFENKANVYFDLIPELKIIRLMLFFSPTVDVAFLQWIWLTQNYQVGSDNRKITTSRQLFDPKWAVVCHLLEKVLHSHTPIWK